MNLKYKVSVLFLSLLLLSLILCCTAFAAKQQSKAGWPAHLRFLSGPSGGQWFATGEKIAAVLSTKILPTSNRIGGGMANIGDVNKKTADIAFTLNCFLGAAKSGDPEYSSVRVDNVTLLANAYPQVFYFLVRKEFAIKNEIKTIEDILKLNQQVRFASLRPGTASEFLLRLLLKYGYNSSFKKLESQGWTIDFNNYSEIADDFAVGDIDTFAYTAGTDVPLIHTIEKYTDIVILPVNPKVIDKLATKFKTGKYTIKKGAYKCVKEPLQTVGDYTCLVVRKDLPNDLVYNITKTLLENKATIASNTKDFAALSPKTAMTKGLPIHSGAKLFWDEFSQKINEKQTQ